MNDLFWKKLSKNRKFNLSNFRNTKHHNIFANWSPYERGLTFHNLLIYQFVKSNLKKFIIFKKKINNFNIGNAPGIYFQNKFNISMDDCLSFEETTFLKNNLGVRYAKKKLNIAEIGGGYGRTAEALIKNFKVKTYVIIDYKDILIFAGKYLKKVLTKEEYNKIIFIDFEMFKFRHNYFNNLNFDLVINIDSFHEIEKKIINKYLKFFSPISNNFFIKNAVNKYRPKDMVNHLVRQKPPNYNMKLGMNKKIINIFDNKALLKSKINYIKNYNPYKNKSKVASSFSKIFNFYLLCIYKK